MELYKEYATILYTQKKFDEAIEFYEEFLWYLNKDELNNMYQCYKELGKDKEAGKLKQHYINTM
ncbi:tetratricopeptide repeat protein [Streptococcus mitis]|nr:tetratricopeptide repeat protein [Streptococcus mitis]